MLQLRARRSKTKTKNKKTIEIQTTQIRFFDNITTFLVHTADGL